MSESVDLNKLVDSVLATAKYGAIDAGFIRRVGAEEIKKRSSYKEALKATHARLHQVAAAYQETRIDYPAWSQTLNQVSTDLAAEDLRQFCQQMMKLHASTRERLPILDSFYNEVLSPLGPIHSVLDLACGLNPLTRPWMTLAPDATYFACDIYHDMLEFITLFFKHIHQSGQAWSVDLTHEIPQQPVDLVLMLKTIPCLEQLDKSVGPRLLEGLSAHYLLVSFPAHSLGGRPKGMVKNYEAHFNELIAGQPWAIRRWEFSTELVFLITK